MIAGSTRPRIFTFATLPAAGAYVGEAVRVSDIGPNGSTWEWTGTLWHPVNGACLYHKITTALTSANNSDAQIIDYALLPAGMLSGYPEIELSYAVSKSGASDTILIYFRIGPTLSAAETSIIGTSLAGATANAASTVKIRFSLSGYRMTTLNTVGSIGNSTSTQFAVQALDIGVDNYLIVTSERTVGASETSTLHGFSVVYKK
jgi:hypothetical protein